MTWGAAEGLNRQGPGGGDEHGKAQRDYRSLLTPNQKVAAYGESAYALTNRIPNEASDEWTLTRLEARQERMAQRAVHLWRADFA